MNDETELYEQGRAALRDSAVRPEQPLAENGRRWGLAAVLRPEGSVLRSLEELAAAAGRAAGQDHWVHSAAGLHFTLRSLEHFRASIGSEDPRRVAYAEALENAASGLAPARVELRGVCPHPAGVIVIGYPLDDTLTELQARFAAELRERDLAGFESWVRDRWYVSLIHFAGRTADVDTASVAAWCEERRQLPVGVAELRSAEIARWHQLGAGVRLEPLHRTALGTASIPAAATSGR